MTKIVLDSREKQFIFEFSFSVSAPPPPPPTPIIRSKATIKKKEVEKKADKMDDPLDAISSTEGAPYIELVVYRKDRPKYLFEWAGWLSSQEIILFEVPFPEETGEPSEKKAGSLSKKKPGNIRPSKKIVNDVIRCKGEFFLYTNSAGQRFLWFNMQYGENYKRSHSGCMIQLPANEA